MMISWPDQMHIFGWLNQKSPKIVLFQEIQRFDCQIYCFRLVKRIESDYCRFEQQTEHISPKMWQLEIFTHNFASRLCRTFQCLAPLQTTWKILCRSLQQVFVAAMGMGPSSEVKGNMVQLVWTSTCCPGLKPLQGGPPAWLKDNYETWWRLVIFLHDMVIFRDF